MNVQTLHSQSTLSADSHPDRTRVIGTGSALPRRRVTNEELSEILETSDEWIRERVGIEYRYVCDKDESSVTLAHEAALKALQQAELSPDDIDLIIFATVTPEKQLPSAAALLAQRLKLDQSLAFDLQGACSGFLYAFQTADALLSSMNLRNALVIGAETLSRVVDWSDRNTAVLFGDGAGACILQRPEEAPSSCILASHLKTCGSAALHISRRGGNFPDAQYPATTYETDSGSPYMEMNGREVFRSGVQFMTASIREVLRTSGVSPEELTLFIPHQSNIRMIQSVCRNIGISDPAVIATNIDRVGNTSAASVPIVLDEKAGAGVLQSGDLVLMTAVGSGMTYGSILFRW